MKEQEYFVGQKLYLRQTGEHVEISRITNDEWIYVMLEGDEIPVPREELMISPPEIGLKDVSLKRPDATKPVRPQNDRLNEKQQGQDFHQRSNQILIAFEPYLKAGEIESFQIYLINDTNEAITFEYNFFLNG